MARELAIDITVNNEQAIRSMDAVDQTLDKLYLDFRKAGDSADEATEKVEKFKKSYQDSAARRRAKEELDGLGQSTESVGKKSDAASKHVEAIRGAVLRYAAPAAIGLAIKNTAEFADKIVNLSNQTGIAPGRLQALGFAAKQVGLELDPVARGVGALSDKIASGDKSAVGAIRELGLSVQTLKASSPDAAFLAIATEVAKIENPMDRARVATDLFGARGRELLPLLTQDIDELMKKAEDLGLVMSDASTKDLANFNNKLDEILGVGKRLLVAFFEPLIPLLNGILGVLTPLTAKLSQFMTWMLSPLRLETWYEWAELLGIINVRMATLPKAPGAPGMALPTPFQVPDPFAPGGLGGQSWDFVNRQLTPKRGGKVLPFQRPELMGETDYMTWLLRARGPIPTGVAPFPGWAIPPALMGTGLNYGDPRMWNGTGLGMLRGTVPMNAPGGGGGGGFFGNLFGGFTGGLKNMWQGMSGGGGIGGLFGNLGSGLMTGGLSSLLGTGMSLAMKGLGKLFGFGPSESEKTGKARTSFIDQFGGMDALKKAADAAGFSLDKMLNARKVKDFDAEVKKLTSSIDQHKSKLEGIETAQKGVNLLTDAFARQMAGVTEKTVESQAQFDRLGSVTLSVFSATLKETGSLTEALDAVGPSLDTLIGLQKDLGFEAGGAVGKLLDIRETITANKDVFDSVEGVRLVVEGLGKAGLLTKDDFNTLGREAAFQLDTLRARGIDSDKALALMQPTLQALWEAQQKFGFETDEATQALLDQAKNLGIVGPNMKDIQSQIRDVLFEIRDALIDVKEKGTDAARNIALQFRTEAIPALHETRDAVNEVIEMHSPTGLEGIYEYTGRVIERFGDLVNLTRPRLRDLQRDINAIALSLDDVLRNVGNIGYSVPRDEHGRPRMPGAEDFITEAEAIRQINEQFRFFIGRDATHDELLKLAAAYGYRGGGRVLKSRFQDFMDRLIGEYIRRILEEGGFALGGLVLDHGKILRFGGGGLVPNHSDTVPAMLTPGELVLQKKAVGRLVRGDWPQSGGLTISIGTIDVGTGYKSEDEFGEAVSKAVIDAAKRQGVRFAA